MGYTHYWSHDRVLNGPKLFAAFNDIRKLLGAVKGRDVEVCGGNGNGEAYVGEAVIFNGCAARRQECEGFRFPLTGADLIDSVRDHGRAWDFCKTNREPYDLVVCATLLVLKHHLGDQLRVNSDGDREDDEWIPAELFVEEVLGYKQEYKPEKT